LVRVWYHSVAGVGQTIYSLRGFVYPKGRGTQPRHQRR
jgi:hypothetical protein